MPNYQLRSAGGYFDGVRIMTRVKKRLRGSKRSV